MKVCTAELKFESIVTVVYIAAYNNYMYYLLLLNKQTIYRSVDIFTAQNNSSIFSHEFSREEP